MMRNTDNSYKDGRYVGPEAVNIDNPLRNDRTENKNDVTPSQGTFLRREPIVLLFIVCLSLVIGIITPMRRHYFYVQEIPFHLYSLFASVVPVAGITFAAFLSEVTGRKPVFIYLFVLAILSPILHISSSNTVVMFLTLFLQSILAGGASVMSSLTIAECSSPKHRFTWMTANVATFHTILSVSNFISWETEVVTYVLSAIQIVLGLMCLGSTWVWPESPYWLASKMKLEESRKAFLFLRGEESREELVSVLKARRRPGPPKLFWSSLGIGIAIMSVTIFSNLIMMQSFEFYQREDTFELQYIVILLLCVFFFSITVVMSYFLKRKVLFAVVFGITIILSYVEAFWIWMYRDQPRSDGFSIVYMVYLVSDVISKCGFMNIGTIMLVEILPFKYNTVILCICFIVMYVCNMLLFPLHFYLERKWSFHPAAPCTVYTTLALVGSLLFYFFAPETKDKSLLEIQRAYSPDENDSNPDQNLSMIQNVTVDEQIVSTISSSRVSVLVGAAGCGKSSRAPAAVLRGSGGAAVLVAGPRRVAAIGLARRVASELGEQVGETVGYQVRLDSKPPRPPAGSILYCTSGILLRRLQTNPGLHGCTHVFVDEAHERDVNTDLSVLLLKRAVDLNPELRVVVMSATLDTEVFTRYFDECPVIEVPGRTFPVQTSYLDDIRKKYNLELSSTWANCGKEDAKPVVNCQEVAEVIKAVDRAEAEGAILVFLPGWAEIKLVKQLLDQSYPDSTHLILPVHSRLSTTEQARMFSRPLPGVRKVVLATNIAETSITIPDAVFVVDCGAHKENRLKEGTGTASLDTVWVSQAGARQRAGRAGRVQPGHCFKLYTKEKEDDFAPFTTPEILRVPLEQTVLDCKTYAPDEKVESFLSQLPEPPTHKAIQLAVNDLIDLGALTRSEQLTRLGTILSSLTVHPRLGRGLLASAAVGNCVAAATCIALCQDNTELFADAADRREEIREIKRGFSATSDHAALYWIQEEFERVVQEKGWKGADDWCGRHGLRKDRLAHVKSVTNLYLEQLLNTPLVQPSPDVEELNRFSGVDELLPSVLLSGANQLLSTRASLRTKGKLMADVKLVTSNGDRAHISSESVNHEAKRSRGALFASFGGFHSRERRALVVRLATRVAPVDVLALAPGIVHKDVSNEDTTPLYLPRHKLKIQVPTSQVDNILRVREMFENTFQYYVEREPREVSYEENAVVSRFKVRLVKTIGRMLVEAHKELTKTNGTDVFR